MTEKIRAPWTSEQVEALNRFQQRGGMHPFTCGLDRHGNAKVLIATEYGWRCPDDECDYTQDWAHAFMADPNAWPRSPFGERHGPTPQEASLAAVQATELQERLARIKAEVALLCECCGYNRERMARIRAELGLPADGVR